MPLTPAGVNVLVGLPVAPLAESMGWLLARGLMAVGEGGRALDPDPPFCWEDRRRCVGRDAFDLSSGAALFWPASVCLLSFSASTLAFTLCITVNSSWFVSK